MAAIFFYFFFVETSEVVFSTYIYDYARCSKNLTFDSADGTTLNAIFWGTMMLGRGIGIVLATYITPTVYAYIDLVVCFLAVMLLTIPQILGNELVYGVTAVFGLAMATVYGNGVLMTAKRMNVSGSYMWMFFFSAQLAPMFNPIAASSLMGIDMESFVYINVAMCGLGLFCIPAMKLTFQRLRKSGRLIAAETNLSEKYEGELIIKHHFLTKGFTLYPLHAQHYEIKSLQHSFVGGAACTWRSCKWNYCFDKNGIFADKWGFYLIFTHFINQLFYQVPESKTEL